MKNYNNLKSLKKELEEISFNIAKYLDIQFNEKTGFPGREFYGIAFTLWLWSFFKNQFNSKIDSAKQLIKEKDKIHSQEKYHWEFVRFALWQAQQNIHFSIHEILPNQKFAYTRVANWTLLRSTVRIATGNKLQKLIGRTERSFVLFYFQTKSGFIEDEKSKPTLQYHAFSTLLLGIQIYELGEQNQKLKKSFFQALEVLDTLSLKGGQCNYFGRGQGQAFGYAAAIMAFVLGALIFNNRKYLEQVEDILLYVKKFIRTDGSVPLVLNSTEPPEPFICDTNNKKLLGWYSYNNFFDYLPFLGALLMKSAKLLEKIDYSSISLFKRDKNLSYKMSINNIHIWKTSSFTTIISKPFSTLSATLTFPYIEINGQYPLPCYGGEEYNSYYTSEGLPLPILYTEQNNPISLYNILKFSWIDMNTLYGVNKSIQFKRSFSIENNRIIINDIFICTDQTYKSIEYTRIFVYKHQSTLKEDKYIYTNGIIIASDEKLKLDEREYYSAFGQLNLYKGDKKNIPIKKQLDNQIIISIGETIEH